MAEDLYGRYMAAARAYREHEQQCTSCSSAARCGAGQRLYDLFSQLQDAYLARQRRG
ncbi:hypothetical protein M878_46085 (plasmid) [Streptomyces roseochromogenus subsp. oscitans DS 12.976]|uniref:Uncharacterized protein n=1 Tax=Streptomyces roseochromogenus subsp. oscitans DS 12.976 TaxID=1352936 RepID=V6JDR2_STRRC|nr:hypothetical protein M878_46085 [Streptomyces roseochromogenus subsp. oscitans DS 12.976]